MSLIRTSVLVPFMIAASLSLAQDTLEQRRAWEWTIEERLSQRFDPADIAERGRAWAEANRETFAPQASSATITDNGREPLLTYVIDGGRNPELFLPHEILDALLTGLSPDEARAARQRQFYESRMEPLGLGGADFWHKLRVVTSEYLALKYGDHQTTSDLNDLKCRTRYEALAAARQSIAHFDEILYTAIAPSMRYSAATSARQPAALLRSAERGC